MASPLADYVNIQFPMSMSAAAGVKSQLIYGQIYEPGITPTAGASSSIIAQLGYGPAGSDPTTSSAWLWVDATFNTQAGNNDEYKATLTVPNAGEYAYTFRFAINDGVNPITYTYADTDGAGANPGLSYDPTKLGSLTVEGPDANGYAGQGETIASPVGGGERMTPLPDGGFAMVWINGGIVVQRFDDDGNKVGGEITVATGNFYAPSIIALNDGTIAVSYMSYSTSPHRRKRITFSRPA
jgi:hypothetical protein